VIRSPSSQARIFSTSYIIILKYGKFGEEESQPQIADTGPGRKGEQGRSFEEDPFNPLIWRERPGLNPILNHR